MKKVIYKIFKTIKKIVNKRPFKININYHTTNIYINIYYK